MGAFLLSSFGCCSLVIAWDGGLVSVVGYTRAEGFEGVWSGLVYAA